MKLARKFITLLEVLAFFLYVELNSPVLLVTSTLIFRKLDYSTKGQGNGKTSFTLEVVDDKDFTKPVTSDKKYRFIKLQNELLVFLISHSSASEASARMGVRVGYFKDPDSLPGLTHYLEHLLFINTEKYPELDGFSKHVALHNGYTNAYTSDTETVYEFNSDPSSFEEALSMFSEFFKFPLFDETYTDKELMSVENEFNLRKNSRYYRYYHVIFEISDKRSLSSRFFIGNLETLRNIPKSHGINVREEVIRHYKNEYSSNRMVLVLASNHTLDELEDLAGKYFFDIENKKLPVNSIYTPIQDGNLNPYNVLINKLVLIESLDELTILTLIFPMKGYMAKYQSQDRSLYLEKLISSSRRGSLGNYLLSNKLISSISVDVSDSNLGFSDVKVIIGLSYKGEEKIAEIIISLFTVLKFLSANQLPREIYDEQKKILDYSFKYSDPVSIVNESEDIISNYFKYECKPEEVLRYNKYISDFDSAIHREIISQLTPENLFVTLEHSNLEDFINNTEVPKHSRFCNSSSITSELEKASNTNSSYGLETILGSQISLDEIRTEKYIGTKYLVTNISSCFLSKLLSLNESLASEKYGTSFPRPNPYLSSNFSDNLKEVDEEKVPIRLSDAIQKFQARLDGKVSSSTQEILNAYNNYFYYPTKSIATPKSIVQFSLTFPLHKVVKGFSEFPTNTVRINFLFEFLMNLLQLVFSNNLDQVEAASYVNTFSASVFSDDWTSSNLLSFRLYGFTDRMEDAISKVPEIMRNFTSYVTENEFDAFKEDMINSVKSSISNPQISRTVKLMESRLFFNQDFSPETELSQLESISFDEFTRFSNFYMKNPILDGFLLGNLNPLQSARIVDKFSSVFLTKDDSKLNTSSSSPASSWTGSLASSIRSLISLIQSRVTGARDDGFLFDMDGIKEHLRSSPPLDIVGDPDSLVNFQILDPLSLEMGSRIYYYHLSTSKYDENSAIIMKVAIGYKNLRTHILSTILSLIVSSNFFSEIRTEKQLGYVVDSKYSVMMNNISCIRFTVISSNNNVQTLAENTLEFFDEWFSPDSKKITEALFEVAKQSLIDALKIPNNNIPEYFSEFISEITSKNYKFDMKADSIRTATNLTYADLLNWFRNVYNKSNIFMMAIQSSKLEDSNVLSSLPNFVPKGFTKFTPSDSLFTHKNVRTYNQWKVFNGE